MKRNTLILACLVTLLLAFPAATGNAGGSPPSGERSRLLLELLDDEDPDCERVLRFLLGLEDDEALDGERIVRFLLGIEDSDAIDREQIVRMLQGTGSAGVD
jgi:hypothetical protein